MANHELNLAVIAGGDYAGLVEDYEAVTVDEEYSDRPVDVGHIQIAGEDVKFIARHKKRQIPLFVKDRANIQALKSMGVNAVLTVSRAGRMAEEVHIGNLVNFSSVVFHTMGGKPATFSIDEELMIHAPTAFQFSENLRSVLNDAWPYAQPIVQQIYDGTNLEANMHGRGLLFNHPYPWFNNAEQEAGIRNQFPDVKLIGQTKMPESALLREMGIIEASIGICSDNASFPGAPPGHHAGDGGVMDVSAITSQAVFALIQEAVPMIPKDLRDFGSDGMRMGIAPGQYDLEALRQSHPIMADIIQYEFAQG